MDTSLPFEVYIVWGLVILLIIVCCVALFIWAVSAIGEKSEQQITVIFRTEKEARDFGVPLDPEDKI